MPRTAVLTAEYTMELFDVLPTKLALFTEVTQSFDRN
jgi:hypothetical protein